MEELIGQSVAGIVGVASLWWGSCPVGLVRPSWLGCDVAGVGVKLLGISRLVGLIGCPVFDIPWLRCNALNGMNAVAVVWSEGGLLAPACWCQGGGFAPSQGWGHQFFLP